MIDPIHKLVLQNNNWQLLFIEPVPYLFEKLKKNYGSNQRFKFENSAVNNGSNQIFYSVKEEAIEQNPHIPYWYDQLGSFRKENILKHLNGILEPYIEETIIEGLTFNEVIKKNNIDSIDLLHIDTEGYDWIVLSQLDLMKYYPTIILYEHKHLKESEKKKSINFLTDKYAIFNLGQDYICISKQEAINKSQLPNGKFINPD